ncbi:barstar family protein [Dokdonia sp.]|uniref:barstar family protein n=1 Tax=Dokdonia sp. TaxID=2024995 RepID=UPI0032677E90
MIGLRFDNYPKPPNIIAYIADIGSLKFEKIEGKYHTINIQIKNEELNSNFENEREKFVTEGYLSLLDQNKKILGELSICDITILEKHKNSNLILTAKVHESRSGELDVWKMYFQNSIKTVGLWKELSEENKEGWLVVSYNFQKHKITKDKDNLVVKLDGELIDSELDFYCALGEAVNGIGGYFGFGLDGLHDCFCGGFGVGKPFTLIWSNHEYSKRNLENYFDSIISIFKEYKYLVELK